MLEQCESDTLILLDCCAAASSATASGNGVTELIAACGFETWAPGVGEHSFSRSLIEELKCLGRGPPFSVALLHNKVLSRIKYWKPRYTLPFTSERRKTPIYIQLANELNRRSIEISPLPQQEVVPSPGTSPQPAVDSTGQSSVSEDVDMLDSEPSQSSLAEVWPDPNFASPKVLISVALEDDQRLRPDDWNEWLRLIPALTKYMRVEGVYKSDSTVIVGLVSVAIWDLLPEHSAISFVCFVRSNNLLSISPSYPDMSIAAYDRNGYNTKVSNSTPGLVDKAVSPLKDINSSSQAHTSTHTPIFPEDKSEAQPDTLQGFLNKASYVPDRKPYRQAKVENFLHGQSDRVHWLPTSRKNKPNRSMFRKLSRMISTVTVKDHSALPSPTSTKKEPQDRSYLKPNSSPLARLNYSAATGAAPDPAQSKLTDDGVPADDRRHGGEARRIAYPLKSSKGVPKHKDSSEKRWDSNSSTAVGSVHGANRTNTTTTYKDHPEDRWEGSSKAISEKSFLPDVLPVTAKYSQEKVGGHGDFQFPPTTHASYDPKARLWSRTTRGKPPQAYGDGSLHSLYRSALSPR
ncbi:MAG: hypothetical protein LQ341_001529 [Variospora aurantia]|nr:MAG: hypothetical protein LQ341_001529 [Variospora aurantia]